MPFTLVWFHSLAVKMFFVSCSILEPFFIKKMCFSTAKTFAVFADTAIADSSQTKLSFLSVSEIRNNRKKWSDNNKEKVFLCTQRLSFKRRIVSRKSIDGQARASSLNHKLCEHLRNDLIFINAWWRSEAVKDALGGREKRAYIFLVLPDFCSRVCKWRSLKVSERLRAHHKERRAEKPFTLHVCFIG